VRRVLLLATTTGYQTRAFGEAAERVGVDLVFATDRCDMIEDPWRDGAIPIRFHDEDMTHRAARERNAGFVFQHYAAFKHMTVRDNVAFGLKIRKRPKPEIEKKVNELLGIVGLDGFQHRYPAQLSGGMRQRVCIAVALACGPKLLFADEPTTALDVTVQAQVLDLMAQQQRERFMAMVLITHDLGVVAGRADEIAVMYAGRIVEKASTNVLFSDMKMPYTDALLSSIPKLGDRSHTRLATIPGRPPDLVNPPTGCKFAPRCAYVQDRCQEEEPPLQTATPGHEYRCWFPVGTPEGVEALERNKREGTVVAAAALTQGG